MKKLREGAPWGGIGGGSPSSRGAPAGSPINFQVFAQMKDQGPDTNPPSGFPFKTRTAERVWLFAQFLVLENPTMMPPEIVRQAILKSNQSIEDLTPEDIQLLLLAVEWAQNGAPSRGTVREPGPTSLVIPGRMGEARLQEFQGGSSFPGPEPGKVSPITGQYVGGAQIQFQAAEKQRELDRKRYKDRFKSKRKALYQLMTWLRARQDPSSSPNEK